MKFTFLCQYWVYFNDLLLLFFRLVFTMVKHLWTSTQKLLKLLKNINQNVCNNEVQDGMKSEWVYLHLIKSVTFSTYFHLSFIKISFPPFSSISCPVPSFQHSHCQPDGESHKSNCVCACVFVFVKVFIRKNTNTCADRQTCSMGVCQMYLFIHFTGVFLPLCIVGLKWNLWEHPSCDIDVWHLWAGRKESPGYLGCGKLCVLVWVNKSETQQGQWTGVPKMMKIRRRGRPGLIYHLS